jgi:hypothetical protein
MCFLEKKIDSRKKILVYQKTSAVLQQAQNDKFDYVSASDGVVAHHRSQTLSFLLFTCYSLMNSFRTYVLLSNDHPKFSANLVLCQCALNSSNWVQT